MAIITKLSRLIEGVSRDVDLSQNTLKVQKLLATESVDIGPEGAATSLTQTALDTVLAHEHASGSDNQTIEAGSGLTGGGSGATVTINVGAGDGIQVTETTVEVDSSVARKFGITMESTANITMQGGGEVLGLPSTPSGDGAATSKSYVDSQNAAKVNKSGDLMSGTLTMGAQIDMQGVQKIVNLAGGTNPADAVNKSQLDEKAALTQVVRKDISNLLDNGVSITLDNGEVLGLPAIPGGNTSATSKKYVDDQDALKANAADVVKKDGSVAFTADQSMGGNQLTDVGSPTVDTDAATKKYVDDQDALKVSKAGDTLSGFLTLHADPTSDLHAATKAYVDSVAQGLDVHAEVTIKMDPDDLPAFTASGANATKLLTANSNGALGTIQGHVMVIGDSLMLVNSPETTDDGIYVVEDLGSVSTPWILRRRAAEDGTPAKELTPGDFFFVSKGTFASSGWVVTADGDLDSDHMIDIDNGDKFTVVQFSGAGTYSADGQGIELAGTQFSIELDGSTLVKSAAGIKVANSGIGSTQIADDAVITTKIVDSAVTSNKIAGLAVTTSHLAANSVTTDKIANAAITADKLSSAVAGDGLTGGAGSALDIDHDGEGLTISAGKLALELDGSTLTKSAAGIKLADGGIVDAHISATAAIDLSKLMPGTGGDVIIADTLGVPRYVQVSGDVAISEAGVTSIAAGAVTNNMLAGTITDDKLDQIVTADKVAGSAVSLKMNGGLKDDGGLAVEPLHIAGDGLEDDGTDKLRIKLAPNSGLVLDSSGLSVAGGATTPVVAGQAFTANITSLVRFAMSGETAGRAYKADNDATTSDKFYVVGLVQPAASIAAGDTMAMISFGSLTLGSSDVNFAAADIGKPVYLSSSGGFTVTPPTTTSSAVVQVGVVQAVNKIWVQHVRVMGVN